MKLYLFSYFICRVFLSVLFVVLIYIYIYIYIYILYIYIYIYIYICNGYIILKRAYFWDTLILASGPLFASAVSAAER